MSANTAINVSMTSFQKLGTKLSPAVTLCVRGRHAVGKSEGVYQIGRKIFHDFYKSPEWAEIRNNPNNGLPHELKDHKYEDGLPVIERRLSQMSEGDIVGLPFMNTNPRTGGHSTAFEPCDWLLLAAEFPVLLFLDERNRALEGVKQAVFQLTDSKAFYGKKLHTDTRIIVAENTGEAYQVQDCDPAEVSRCVTVQLEPTFDEFVNYIKDFAHQATVDFFRDHGDSVLEHKGNFEPNKKYPDRRAWVALDSELQKMDAFDEPDDMFHTICCGFIGAEIGTKFSTYVKSRDKNVTAEEIMKDWEKAKKKLRGKGGEITNQAILACSAKISDKVLAKKTVTDLEAANIASFMFDLPAEARIALWTKLATCHEALFKVHPHVKDLIVATRGGSNVSSLKRPDIATLAAREKGSSVPVPEANTPDKAKRGARR